ncbi:MAG TPA: UDP-N-acetylmuramoylalanyl-D-glutamyl-2, 6-diaminopimelate--D-alanyl-D-alanine ligase, partial [Pseudoxanthomonas sp.]|nr:UDP-N-acetylmuramoylalanyl-D-glutamyl-2, 6-diaminopimelate--D-alanyl-D-alanine ligase [Pseudoxanthomonas sp.]
GGRHCPTHEALAATLRADLRAAPGPAQGGAGRRLLVKGSRGSAMDRIVTALLAQGDATDAA